MLDDASRKYWTAFQAIGQERVPSFKTPSIFVQNLGKIDTNTIYLLRDDLIPFYLGGNKARKAFFYKAYFIEKHIDCVMTYGTPQSNHARAIALLASELGIDSYLICPGMPGEDGSNNSKIRHLARMQVCYCPLDRVKETIDKEMDRLGRRYQNPYFIPGGGHDLMGTLAMVDLMFKIQDWEEEHKTNFHAIYFASGTGGTQAGLAIGKELSRALRDKVHTAAQAEETAICGISIARKKDRGIEAIEEAVSEFNRAYGLRLRPDIHFNTNYIFAGYGDLPEEGRELMRQMLLEYQLPLDPTYTGKAFYGMYHELKHVRDRKVLFVHTGGTPLFYDFLGSEG